jgi:hypothetical protein
MRDKFDPAPFDKYSEASLEAIKADREIDAKLKARLVGARSLHQIQRVPFSHLPQNTVKVKAEVKDQHAFAVIGVVAQQQMMRRVGPLHHLDDRPERAS